MKETLNMERLMRLFDYEHLIPRDGVVSPYQISKRVSELARDMQHALPKSVEKTVGLRMLLEAKECFVRAALEDQGGSVDGI